MNEQPPIMGRLSRFLRGAPTDGTEVPAGTPTIDVQGVDLPKVDTAHGLVMPVAKSSDIAEQPIVADDQVEDADAAEANHTSQTVEAEFSQAEAGTDDAGVETAVLDAPASDAPKDVATDADPIPTPAEPMTDRADVYRLIMLHRRRDPRPSTEIMKAVGGFDNQCTSMLNKGVPPTDAALIAVAAHYGIPTAIEPTRLRDMSHYAGLDNADVIGPVPLSRKESLKRAVDAAHGTPDEQGRRVGGTLTGSKKAKKAPPAKPGPKAAPRPATVIQAAPSPAEGVDQDMASFLRTATNLADRITTAEARATAAETARDEAIARADAAERREAASAKTLAELRAVLGGVQIVADTKPAADTAANTVKKRRHEMGQNHADAVVERMRGDILMAVGTGATWEQLLSRLGRASSPYMMRARNLLVKSGMLNQRDGVYTAA